MNPPLPHTPHHTHRFQWWGFSLQVAYLILIAGGLACKADLTGIHLVGGTSTVLAMIFANDNLQAVDDAGGKLYSRVTTTFVGFMLIALGNYLVSAGVWWMTGQTSRVVELHA